MDSKKEIVFKSEYNFPIFDIPGEFTTTSWYVLSRIDFFAKEFRKPCLTNGLTGETVYYSDIHKIVQKYSRILQNLGFKPGETVLYSSGDCIRLHLFFLSVWQVGGIIRGSYPEDKEIFVERLIESDCRWFLCHTRYVNEVKEILNKYKELKNVKILVLGVNGPNFNDDSIYLDMLQDPNKHQDYSYNHKAGKPADADGENIALVLPTSGTSGKSKGAIYSHTTLLKNIRVHEEIAFTSEPSSDPVLLTGKQSHFTGSVVPLACIASGKNLILLDEMSKVHLTTTIHRFQIKSVFSFPKYLIDIANDPAECKNLTSIRHIITAGMIISPSIIERMKELPNLQEIIINYGMTESGLLTTNSDWNLSQKNIFKALPELRPYSCGKLVPGTSCKVLDIETGLTLGPGLVGELYFHTPLTSQGYLNNPEETKGTFLQGSWLKTGDLGYCDPDGFIYLVDRIKEIFKYYNNHISPSEIENVILQHKSVEEVSVIGISDPEGGDMIPKAIVVLKQNINNNYEISPKDIEEFANNKLANYKHLRGGVVFVDEIPREKSGKISRNLVKKIFANI